MSRTFINEVVGNLVEWNDSSVFIASWAVSLKYSTLLIPKHHVSNPKDIDHKFRKQAKQYGAVVISGTNKSAPHLLSFQSHLTFTAGEQNLPIHNSSFVDKESRSKIRRTEPSQNQNNKNFFFFVHFLSFSKHFLLLHFPVCFDGEEKKKALGSFGS